jgi:hypothetical protein
MVDYEYLTIRQVAENKRYPFSLPSLRTLVFKREKNGLGKAIRKIGGKIYVRRDLFEKWIESHAITKEE